MISFQNHFETEQNSNVNTAQLFGNRVDCSLVEKGITIIYYCHNLIYLNMSLKS